MKTNRYQDQTRLTLKAIKYFAAMSEETCCYKAKLYFDGKLAGEVSNRGNGGCDDYWPAKNAGLINQHLQEYINALDVSTFNSGEASLQVMPDLEMICAHLLAAHLIEKDYKRAIKNRVLFVENGELRQTKVNISPAVLASWANNLAERDGVTHVFNRAANPEDMAIFNKLAVQS